MEGKLRQPVVAGAFYPEDSTRLRAMVQGFLGSDVPAQASASVGAIVPHAGYVYSGRVAGAGLRAASEYGRPERIVLLGASHSGAGGALATPDDTAWHTPLGNVALDVAMIERLNERGVARDPGAFRREHSMEVVVPFLQVLFPSVPPLVPICVQIARWAELAEGAARLAEALGSAHTWVIASSDFTHYEPDSVARSVDRAALDRILAGDAEGFHRMVVERRLSICGAGAICVLLLWARSLGLTRGTLVEYATSGDATGDRSTVVGYAAAMFAKESA